VGLIKDNQAGIFYYQSKTIFMSRRKQKQIIEGIISNFVFLTKNRCSLSETDTVLSDAIENLKLLSTKKGKTNQQVLEAVSEVVDKLNEYLTKD